MHFSGFVDLGNYIFYAVYIDYLSIYAHLLFLFLPLRNLLGNVQVFFTCLYFSYAESLYIQKPSKHPYTITRNIAHTVLIIY